MAKPLIQRLRDNLKSFDFAAMSATADELEYLRSHKDAVARLSNYEGRYKHIAWVNQEISNLAGQQYKLIKVESTPLDSECLFRTYTTCCEYDGLSGFTWELVASDYLNYFSKIRDSFSNPAIYGPNERWVIWTTGPNGTLNRVEVEGNLSTLHFNFPDEITALIARDAGVTASDFSIPLLCFRYGKRTK